MVGLLDLGRKGRRQCAGPAAGSAYLDGVVASTVFDLDATIADSYAGSGTTWANLIAAPADGSAQTDYDFYRGDGATGTTYPAFNGTGGSVAAYWSFDGGDYFRLKSGANTALLAALHKTTGGADFWLAFTYRPVDASTFNHIFSTQTTAAGVGLRVQINNIEDMSLIQRGTANASSPSTNTAAGTDHVAIFSYSHTTGEIACWIDTVTGSFSALAFNTTTGTANLAHIGGSNGATNALQSGSRLYSFAMGNEYLDNTKAAAIIAHLEARHGRDYTP